MSAGVVVFVGPTLAPAEVGARCPGATVLPPVALGDVTRVARTRPRAIAIIDGFFERQPSVYHKEVLWALSEGVPVYGSSSMGALRSAELHPFGMVGVGRIAEMYRTGELVADDEVAIAHGTAESCYRALSEALVNVRATTHAAVVSGVLAPDEAAAVVEAGRGLYYPDRVWPAILDGAAGAVAAARLDAFRAWLPAGRVDQKADDACELLALLATLPVDGAPPEVGFELSRTPFWEDVVAAVDRDDAGPDGLGAGVDDVVEEIRLDPGRYLVAEAAARHRSLGSALADVLGYEPADADLADEVTAWRHEQGLVDGDAVTRWREEHGVSPAQLVALLRERARQRWAEMVAEPRVGATLVDHLVLDGCYPDLARQARAKRRWLRDRGLEHPPPGSAGCDDTDLLAAFAAREPDLTGPDGPDAEVIADRLGFGGPDQLLRALRRDDLTAAG
ncbi:MAG TPA: TfuA-like protein [Iamia sp.]